MEQTMLRCKYCDKTFTPVDARQKFCSMVCRRNYHNAQHYKKMQMLGGVSQNNTPNKEVIKVLTFGQVFKVWVIKDNREHTYYWKSFKNDRLSIESDGVFPDLISCISDARKAFI